jgi:hypothetical protein
MQRFTYFVCTAVLTLTLFSTTFAGTIVGARANHTGTIVGARTGNITGARTGNIAGASLIPSRSASKGDLRLLLSENVADIVRLLLESLAF